MALIEDFEANYEGSDESSESEMLDRSLSVWRGWWHEEEPDFKPVPLDLHTAASIGEYDCVWAVIQRADEDLNRPNVGGWSALMYASYIGHERIVTLLLEAHCQANTKNHRGQTPLMLAASCGNVRVAELLLQAGADLESRDKKGWTGLFHATYSGHQNMVKFLLDYKANTEVKDSARDFTPFMEAAHEGHEIIVQYFLQHGVRLETRTLGGDTARSLAFDKGHTKIVSLIDNHLCANQSPLRAEPGLDNWNFDDNYQNPNRRKLSKHNGPMIGEGPEAFARMIKEKKIKASEEDGPHRSASPLSDSDNSEKSRFSPDITRPPLKSRYFNEDSSRKQAPGVRKSLGSPRQGLSPAGSPGPTIGRPPRPSDRGSPQSGITGAQLSPGAVTARISPVTTERVSPAHSPDLKQSVICGKTIPEAGTNASRATARPPPGFRPLPSGSLPAATVQPTQNTSRAHAPTVSATAEASTQGGAACGSKLPFTNAYQTVSLGQLPQLGNLTPDSSLNSSQIAAGLSSAINSMKIPDPVVGSKPHEVKPPAPVTSIETPDRGGGAGVARPKDLDALLSELNLAKYLNVFEEQDVDLTVFLTLTDADLKQIGIDKFGPRRKMTNAIARWNDQGSADAEEGRDAAYVAMLEARVYQLSNALAKVQEAREGALATLEQEKQVRAVMETAYLEGRAAFQHVQQVCADSRVRCASTAQLLTRINQFQGELARRFGTESQFSRSTGHGGVFNFTDTASMSDQLRMSKEEQDLYPQIQRMPTQQLIRKVREYTEQLVVNLSVISKNTELLARGAGLQASQQLQPRIPPAAAAEHSFS